MLVLSRKKFESVVINENIVVTVADIRGDKVRLGIEAPAFISVHRSEIQSKRLAAGELEKPYGLADEVERLGLEIERLTFELQQCRNERAA